jgi:putative ATP-binding cassette transporter
MRTSGVDRLSLWASESSRPLVLELSFEIEPGQRLLTNGPNGAGKSALFKATAGLWRHGRGRIIRPRRERMMFLPERPYTIPGTLRDQLIYGLPERNHADNDLADKLVSVGLGYLFERGGLDAQSDWVNELSEGEQQLLAIARLLVARPPFALLDYATSASTPDKARQVYETLARSSITYIASATRSFSTATTTCASISKRAEPGACNLPCAARRDDCYSLGLASFCFGASVFKALASSRYGCLAW